MDPLRPNHFPPADKAAWRAQVQKDLKDAAAPDSLRWETPEGFTLEPYYTANDLITLPLTTIQAAQKPLPGWLNAPQRCITDPKSDNASARSELARGADALVVDLAGNQLSETDASRLLNGIKLSDTPVYFQMTSPVAPFVETLRRVAPYQLKGGLLTDPLAHALQIGKSSGKVPGTMHDTADATRATADSPHFRTVCGSSHVFHNAGANATQELAFLLASIADQYDGLTDAGLTIDQLAPKTVLSLSVGTSYFMEIAKLRALRVLWARFLSAYQPAPTTVAAPLVIHAQTSTFYDATRSPYTNLLRATTEAMAAVIGGCDVLTVHPYNAVLTPSTETSPGRPGPGPDPDPAGQSDRDFSERVARNVSVLMTEESYLDKVADPSAGSYYIETLTHEVVEAAWALFLRVEALGGLLKAVASGFVTTEINAAYQTKLDALRNGRVMVGVNKFQEEGGGLEHPADRMAEPSFDVEFAVLPDRRLARDFEN
ncbi:MAG: methylmalonyl-CoA mutase [Bacteroidetes bacterium]|nr:methylmalonyl-CoA mutase [Fibrella sp.]